MSNPSQTLLELASRVEGLTGPCREMDLAIMRAISGHPWRWAKDSVFSPQTVITWDQYGKDAVGNPVVTLEEFTKSVDDAMTLGDPAAEISISTLYGVARVEYPLNYADQSPYSGEHLGGLIAPAICAAILRARTAKDPSHGG